MTAGVHAVDVWLHCRSSKVEWLPMSCRSDIHAASAMAIRLMLGGSLHNDAYDISSGQPRVMMALEVLTPDCSLGLTSSTVNRLELRTLWVHIGSCVIKDDISFMLVRQCNST